MVISVGIDVSKDKHDCFVVSSEGEVLADVFTISNNMDAFHCLLQRIRGGFLLQDTKNINQSCSTHGNLLQAVIVFEKRKKNNVRFCWFGSEKGEEGYHPFVQFLCY